MEDPKTEKEYKTDDYLDICTGNRQKDGGLNITSGARGVVYHSVENDGLNEKRHGVCMPSPCALGCTFDRELVREVGRAVASAAKEGGFNALLSPDAGIVRSPLCGSMADRFGEDPYLCGTLAAEWVSGVQSEGVAAVLDNFAGSGQSTGKFTCDSMIDKRALYEIYLKPFEIAVKQSSPKGIRCGFNKINGLAGCENHVLLTDILRRQWKFEGVVISDLRTADAAEAMACGVDMSYPSVGWRVKRRLKKGIRDEIIPRHYPKASAARIKAASEFTSALRNTERLKRKMKSISCRNSVTIPNTGIIIIIRERLPIIPPGKFPSTSALRDRIIPWAVPAQAGIWGLSRGFKCCAWAKSIMRSPAE